jgi:hypothetical protein
MRKTAIIFVVQTAYTNLTYRLQGDGLNDGTAEKVAANSYAGW